MFLTQKDPPYGTAYRLGVPELQTKFDRHCLYKNMHFLIKTSFLLIKTTETCFDHNSSKTTIRDILQKTFTVAQSLESELLIWNASDTITNTFSKFETAAPETATRPRER